MTILSPARHTPRLALEWIAAEPGQLHRVVAGTMVFADISGFTALSERLATKGRIGAEELVETLSRVFGAMLDAAAERGGELIKFGGDALLFLFEGDDHALQAASAAVEMRAALRRASEIVTSVGRLALSISIGVHTGAFDYFLVGSPHRELVVLGPGTTAVLAAERAAEAGQIVVSRPTAAHLPSGAVRERGDGELLLRWRRPVIAPGGHVDGRAEQSADAAALLPAILYELFDGTRPDPAHRVGTIAFMRFSGTDAILAEQGPEALADRLHRTLMIAQQAFAAEDVALLCVDCDADGGKLFASSGVPLTNEDDEGRMLRAARAILAAEPPLPIQIGINRGHVFAAEVGTPRRAAYSAMGDTTNTAARICGKSEPGRIYVHPDVLAHARTRYAAEPVGPFLFKGKATAQIVYRLGDELGPRSPEQADTVATIGRVVELAQLRSIVEQRSPDRGGTAVIVGPVGSGKSRLIHDALADLPPGDVVRAHAEPYGATNAYRVFRDPMRDLLGIERDSPERMAADLRAAVARLVPGRTALTALVGNVVQIDVEPSEEVAALLPQYRPDRTADLVVELLAGARPEGFVLVVDDAHWADAASVRVLERIAQEAVRRPWVVVVARRDEAGGADLEAPVQRVELTPLPEADVRALAIALTEAAPLRPHQLDEVVARAGGNPLFVAELVRAAQQFGSLAEVPTSLQGAIAAQVDVLDPLSKRVLSYASVLGRSFRRTVLTEVLSAEQIELDAVTIERLDRFLAADGRSRWQFRNGVLRDVVYDGLGFHLRARLHGEAGAAMERLSSDLGADADTLALHFALAGTHDKAYRYARAAAERYERAAVPATAAAFLERSIDAARRLDGVTDADLRELWLRLAAARDQAGLLETAIDAFRHAARLPTDELGAAELLLRRAEVRERAGSFPVALRDATAARHRVAACRGTAADSVRARAQAFAATVRQRQERAGWARRLAREAAAAGEACGDRAAMARAWSVISWAALVLGDEDPIEYGRRALGLCGELGDVIGQAQLANNLGGFAYFEGDWTGAIEFYQQSVEGFRQVGHVTNLHLANANLAEVLVNRGHLDAAEPLLRDAVRVLGVSGHLWGSAFAKMHLGRLLAVRGDHAASEALLRDCIDENRRMGSPDSVYEAAIHLGGLLVDAGRSDEALAALAEAAVGAPAAVSFLAAPAAVVRAAALATTGQSEAAVTALAAGIAAARERNVGYDLARLLALAVRLGVSGSALGIEQPAAEARRLFDELGVDQKNFGSP